MNTSKSKFHIMMNNERGFTLIEIIAVLIILGILMAVAVPKYFDISEEARTKAYGGAVAQGLSLCSLAYGKAALRANGEPTLSLVMQALRDDTTDGAVTLNPGTSSAPSTTGSPGPGVPTLEGEFALHFIMDTTGTKNGIMVSAYHHEWDKTGVTNTILLTDRQRKWNLP